MDRRRAATQFGVALFVLVLAVGGVFAASPERQSQAFFMLFGLVGCPAAVRTAMARVVAEDAGVTLHRPFRTVRLRWEEIDRFEVRSPVRRGEDTQVVARLRDGTSEFLPGLDAPAALVRADILPLKVETALELNERLRRQRSRDDES